MTAKQRELAPPSWRWRQTAPRAGASHREAGREGGRARNWRAPLAAETRQEVALRWHLGEASQADLAAEYGVALSTVRRWCAQFEPETAPPRADQDRREAVRRWQAGAGSQGALARQYGVAESTFQLWCARFKEEEDGAG